LANCLQFYTEIAKAVSVKTEMVCKLKKNYAGNKDLLDLAVGADNAENN